MRKSRFLAFCFAFIPGAGQMYMGMMRKGTIIMSLVTLCIALAGGTGIWLLFAPIPVIWFYSFFDTFNLRWLSPEQRAAEDARVLSTFTQYIRVDLTGLIERRHTWVGIGLIVVGLWMVYRNITHFMNSAEHISSVLVSIFNSIPTLGVAAAIILLGIYMLKKEHHHIPDFKEYKNNDTRNRS